MKTKKIFTNRILSLVLALMIVVGLVPMNVLTASAADEIACESTSGCTGTYDNGFCTVCDGYQVPSQNANGYYEISNAGNLYWFTYKVETNLKANAILTADIDLNPGYVFASDGTVTKDGVTVTEGWRYWEPIGVSDYEAGYQGIFDGNLHTVSGMYCIAEGGSSDSYLGLFSRVTGGTVTEVGVVNGYVFGFETLGGIVGHVDSGTISKCWNEVTVMSSSDVSGTSFGGIAGSNTGVIENCYNFGLVSGRAVRLGGIVGSQNTYRPVTMVNNCYNMGAVVPKGDETGYGIIVGTGGERVFNCYYLSESETDGLSGTTAATTTDFSSGKIAYLLNQGITDGSQAWYQTCGQGIPAFTGKTVYAISNSCYIGDGISGYTNQVTVVPVHNYNSNGFCKNMRADGITVCDDYQPCEKDANGAYEIVNAGQLYWFAQQVNDKEELSANAVLTADITINADINAADRRNWTPIGDYELTGKKYSGTFDGRGYKIRGLYCDRGISSCAGLFGKCDGAVLKNINVEASYFYADQLAAAIAGDVVRSQIINCHSINNTIIISSYTAGGVLGGCTDSIVDRCSNTSKVTHLDNGDINNGFRSGGIIGWADDVTITNCWNSGEISARRLAAGGIVGGKSNDLSVKNCYNVGIVTLFGDAVNSGAYSPILGMAYNQEAPGELNIVNCYYLEAAYPDSQRREGTTEKNGGAFKSGEVTYLLNDSKSEGELVWYQTLGVDTYPQFDGSIVYYDDTYGYNNGHIHDWKYELYGKDTITAACMEDGCPITDGGYVTITAESKAYTGTAITDAAKVDYSDNWVGSKDLDISYDDNINVGEAKASFTVGEGDAKVTASTTFKITAADISDATVKVNPESDVYNGKKQEPDLSVEWNGITLTKDTDYVLSWDPSDLTNAGSYTATITGKGNFKGTKNAVFSINPADIKSTVVTLDQNTFVYDGQPHKPTVSVTFNGATLTENVDYEVYYLSSDQIMKWDNDEPVKFFGTGKENCDSINAGQYYAIARGKGNFAANSRFAYAAYTIKQAKNAWVTEPSISGWTYGEAANAPTAEAKFGTVYVLYDGTANDGTTYNGDTPPTKAGSYVARFFVDEAANYEPIGDDVEFIIAKADQAAPTGLTKTDTTYFGKADGKISGLTFAMEFRKEGDSTYTAGFNGTLEYLAAGTYYVRYQGDANHNPSPDAVVNVNAGRKLQIVVPQNQVGYTVTVNKTEMEYEGSYTLKVEIHEGYTATEDFKIIISNWECGQQAGVEETYMNAIADQIIEVQGVADITPPAAEIKVKENKWTSFWNNLTFGLFFKETQDVTITAVDAGSSVKNIQYYLSDRELERDEVRSITDWIDYNGTFKIDPNNHYVVYAKITDHAGNILYINSDGIVLDNIAPTLEGIENEKTYYGDLTVIKSDEQFYDIKAVTLDGEEMGFAEGTYGLIPADNAEHIVVVEDHAGNKTTYTVTVYKNYTVTYKADGEPISTETVGHGKDANLPAVPTKDRYVGKWDSDGKNITGDTTITVVYTEIPVVKPNEVKPENKTDLEDTKKQLEDMLKDDSYTDEDKKNIQDAIDDIDDALEVIGNVEAVEESIVKLPAVDTVKPDDEEAIKAITDAQTAYNALSDYEKSLVDEATKANLDKLAAALVAYDIVEGDGSSWTEDSNHNITFVVNGLFSKFVGIKVDGKDVDKANYEAKAGSTIITLKASYLDTLAVGEHTITVVYTDGSTDGTFNVHVKANSPATGDNSNMFLWIALLFISGGAVITLTVVDRKKRMASNR